MKGSVSEIDTRDDGGRAAGQSVDRGALESLYEKYNRREFVHPDPLEFLYDYPDPLDREIVGLIASSLAYGAVRQILKSVSAVLNRMDNPREFVCNSSRETLSRTLSDFKHRFTTGEMLAAMLYGAGRVVNRCGSLENCFMEGMSGSDKNVVPGICHLVDQIRLEAGCDLPHLLPHPSRGSACKRLNLFLRWMVRKDDVDPGGWYNVSPSKLIVPLDVHMSRICCALGLKTNGQAGMRAAIRVTDSFRSVSPDDPVKYDFALTRLGIREELDPWEFIEEYMPDSLKLQGE